MKWSFKIGSLFGIPVKLHLTFLALVGLLAIYAGSLGGVANLLVMIVLLFGSVLLHELGHALAARKFGVGTKDITLLPIGGVAMLERFPEKPSQEVVIAVAGPAVSFSLALTALPFAIWLEGSFFGTVMEQMAIVNGILCLFNLIPALPMDGGRIFRGLLAMWKGRTEATRIAGNLAKVLALLFMAIGVFYNPMLVLIGVFVYFGASSEQSQEKIRGRLSGLTAGNVMVTNFRVFTPETLIESAHEYATRTMQEEYPVLKAGYVVGTVTMGALNRAMAEQQSLEAISSIMKPVLRFAKPDTPLSELTGELYGVRRHSIPVLEGNRLVGLVFPNRFHAYQKT